MKSFVKHCLTLSALIVPASLINISGAIAANVDFSLINSTPVDLVEFYAAPQGASSWGEDLLDNISPVSSGKTTTLDIPNQGSGCLYNFLAVFENGNRLPTYEINLCNTRQYTFN